MFIFSITYKYTPEFESFGALEPLCSSDMFSALSWLLEPSPTHAHDAQDTDARMEHRWQAEASPETESLPRHLSAEWDEMHEGD